MDNTLSLKEAEYCEALLKGHELSRIKRIESLKKKVRGRLNKQNSENESLFELRIATEFKTAAKNIECERPNLGDSCVDFFCEYEGASWFIDAVSVRESDFCESEGDDLVRIQRIIGGKVFNYKKNKEVKFRAPENHEINVIIVDMRGFNSGVMDKDDIREVSHGETKDFPRHYIDGNALKGIFTNLSKKELVAVEHLKDKIHYIIFTNEKFSTLRELGSDRTIFPQCGGMFSRCWIVRNDSLLGDRKYYFPFEGINEKS